MPKSNDTPMALRPFVFHGVVLIPTPNLPQYAGECIFCEKDKFYVNSNDGLWDCKVCGRKGNADTFLEQLWEESDKSTKDYSTLAVDRKLLYHETLMTWGVAKSVSTLDWLIPGYNAQGKVRQLYRYIKDIRTGKSTLYPTPTLTHHIHGIGAYDARKPIVCVCEGPWDGMALMEILGFTKGGVVDGYSLTANYEASLAKQTSVLAIPGCGSVGEPFKRWLPLLAGKHVILLMDSDHPKTVKDRQIDPAGYSALRRAIEMISQHSGEQPLDVSYLHWGDNGYAPDLPDGYDVRDWLTNKIGTYAAEPTQRVIQLGGLFNHIRPIPSDWVPGRKSGGSSSNGAGRVGIDIQHCEDWNTVRQAWKVAFKWTDGLDCALSAMLACVASTKAVGSQLWLQVIGPPSCGKTSLCEALSTNKQYIYPKSTLRGFHSGYDDGSGRNHSPLENMIDKTLVVKDGDALLQIPNLSQVLSEARDVYDRTSRSSYRTQQSKDWEGLNITFILCGTSSLRQLDTSELGERFLKCDIMEGLDDELEDDILSKVIHQAESDMNLEAGSSTASQSNPDLIRAMQLTGGYVAYVRENAQRLLQQITMTDEVKEQIKALGKFISYMRARPSKTQEETTEREVASRLTIQLLRQAKCEALVLQHDHVSGEAMRRVQRIALSTAKGRTLTIARFLYECRFKEDTRDGLEMKALAGYTAESDDGIRHMLKFLRKIQAVEVVTVEIARGISTPPKWRLTAKLQRLYGEVMEMGGKHDARRVGGIPA